MANGVNVQEREVEPNPDPVLAPCLVCDEPDDVDLYPVYRTHYVLGKAVPMQVGATSRCPEHAPR